jgi:murein DD-endopeptidase MepM/ murein hydrolase activator NlpD
MRQWVREHPWKLEIIPFLAVLLSIIAPFIYMNDAIPNIKPRAGFTSSQTWYLTYLNSVFSVIMCWLSNIIICQSHLTNERETKIYNNGVALSVDKEYLIPVLNSGIVIFVGEKEDYGKAVIIEQTNGIDVWYGNIDNLNVKLYDYVEDGSLIGETISDKLYLVFKKDGKALDYKKYIK